MFEGPLRAAAWIASAIVLVSFALFALDETREASVRTAREVAGLEATRTSAPSADQERDRERAHSSIREGIDDVNDVLVSPFTFAAPEGGNAWTQRGIPALLALLVYGVGVSFLARVARGAH